MKSLEQSNLSALNSTDSLSALNHSTVGLSALLAAKGWRDLSPEIYAAESADQAKEQRLRDAVAKLCIATGCTSWLGTAELVTRSRNGTANPICLC